MMGTCYDRNGSWEGAKAGISFFESKAFVNVSYLGKMRWFRVNLFRGLGAAGLSVLLASSALAEISFRNDVMAVISKAGCNLGTCHGNANGKAGFKLSLRGE